MRIGELCAGYGGLGMGVQAVLGGELAWVSEYEPPSKANPNPKQGAARILAHRFPGVPNLGDMTTVDWSQVEPVDVLTGGTPCQDLSAAGKRAGMTEGTRSNLWVSMREAIAQLRPSLVVWENVRGAYSAPADSDLESREGRLGVRSDGPVLRALGRVLGDLSELGFDAEWIGLRAADVGAPHGRYRVFVVAWPAADTHSLRLQRGRSAWHRRTGSSDGAVTAADTEGDGRDEGRTEPAGQLGGSDAPLGGSPVAPDASVAERRAPQSDCVAPPRWRAAEPGERAGVRVGRGGLDAIPAEARPGEVLRDVRRADGAEAVRCEPDARGHGPFSVAQELFSELWEHEARTDVEGRSSLEGASSPEDGVRAVLGDGEPPCSSPRQGSHEQRPGELENSLLVVPPAVALAGGPGEAHGCGQAGGGYGCSAWRQYAPAIHRWEMVLGRLAPPPTELTAKGAHRLSAHAVEFLMGLPAGWVTDVPGLTRNEQLKALGNGVCPPQAAAALSLLLPHVRSAAA